MNFAKPLRAGLAADDKIVGQSTGTLTHAILVPVAFTLLYCLFFSPALMANKLLAPEDGYTEYAPLFLMQTRIWNELLMCGYPSFADPQSQLWYPLSWLFRGIHCWNGQVISTYVLASSFTYGLAFSHTRSKVCSIIAALIFGLNGWIVANITAICFIQSVMWLPLIIWSVTELKVGFKWRWFSLTVISISMLVLTGQAQMTVYLLFSTMLWCIGQTILCKASKTRYASQLFLALVFALGITAVVWLPAVEFSGQSFLRLGMNPSQLLSFYYPMEVLHFFFPYLFGGCAASPYAVDYFGPRNLQVVSGYLGLISLLLAMIGMMHYWSHPYTKLCLGYTVLMFLSALGDSTPFGQIWYSVPIFNHLRVPTRHFPEVALGISMLAAQGMLAIKSGGLPKRLFSLAVLFFAALLLSMTGLAIITLGLTRDFLHLHTVKTNWQNLAIIVPLLLALCQIIALTLMFSKPTSSLRQAAIVILLLIDLSSFGWFGRWRYESPEAAEFNPPIHASRYTSLLERTHQRMLPVRGVGGSRDELIPNLAALWMVPSASGYVNFVTKRYFEFFTMPDGGFVEGDWSSSNNLVTDLASIRFVFCPKNDPRFPLPKDHTRWRVFERLANVIVLENKRAAPKVRLVKGVLTLPQAAVLKAARSGRLPDGSKFNPLDTALIEEPCKLTGGKMRGRDFASIQLYSSEKIVINANVAEARFLVLSDTFNPSWNAYVDSARTKIYRTNYLFRGIYLPKGKHTIIFRCEPISLYLGGTISTISICLLVILSISALRKSRKVLIRRHKPKPATLNWH